MKRVVIGLGLAVVIAGVGTAWIELSRSSLQSQIARDLGVLAFLLERYAEGHDGAYPSDLRALESIERGNISYEDLRGRIQVIPPTAGIPYEDPWGRPYVFAPPTESDPGHVATLGKDGQEGGDTDYRTIVGEDREVVFGEGE